MKAYLGTDNPINDDTVIRLEDSDETLNHAQARQCGVRRLDVAVHGQKVAVFLETRRATEKLSC